MNADFARQADELLKQDVDIVAKMGGMVATDKERKIVGDVDRALKAYEVTTAIASAVEQQGAATRDISQNVQMAASGTQLLASSITTVNSAISETNRSADQVLGASGEVSTAAERLSSEVQQFFVTLRSRPSGKNAA